MTLAARTVASRQTWTISRVGRFELIRRFVLDRILTRLSRRHRNSGLPHLAAVIGEHVGRTIAVQGLYERDLLEALCNHVLPRLVPDAAACVALDGGANVGNHTVYFARHFASVIAFEPNPAAAAVARANIMLNGLADRARLVELGLSNRDDLIPFEVTIDNLGGSRFLAHSRADLPRLQVRRGDAVLSELQLSGRIGLIKLDLEGFELAALEGLGDTIARHRPVLVFESHDSAQAERIAQLIRGLGYQWFYAVETQRPGGSPSAMGRLGALLTGDTVSVAAIESFEPRYYPMIVASVSALPVSSD